MPNPIPITKVVITIRWGYLQGVWVAVVTPTDRPKSVRNRCVIELFGGVVRVVTLLF